MERITLFSNFWDIDSKNAQDLYLQSLMSKEEVKRRTKPKNPIGPRKTRTSSFKYYIKINGDALQVCKIAFGNIFGVTPDQIRRLNKLLKDGLLPKDLRGKAPAQHAISGEVCKTIEDHIASFPTKTSHYSNKEMSYLNAELTVKQMHNLFKVKYPETKVNYWFYYKIFKERFNLRFGRPQIDSCVTCETLSVKIKSPSLNDAAKRAAVAELLVHKRRSKQCYA